MKKVFLFLLAMFAAVNLRPAAAQFGGGSQSTGGGFDGPRAPSMMRTTVRDALKMRDETIVVLVGKIVDSLGDEKYTFRDKTGDAVIEIDDDDWQGIRVTPDNTLEIVGKIDKEFIGQTTIEVKSFKVME